MPTTTSSMLKWDVLVTNRQGLTRDLPPGKEKWMWVPTSATLIYGERDAVLVDAFLTVEQAHAGSGMGRGERQEPDYDLCHSRPRRSFLWYRRPPGSVSECQSGCNA
jgi:hypothetical protein